MTKEQAKVRLWGSPDEPLKMISSNNHHFVNVSALQNFFLFCLKTDDLILVRILYLSLLPILQSPHNMHSSNFLNFFKES